MYKKGLVPIGKRAQILENFNYSCVYCGDPASEIDHILPRSYALDNSDGNLVASCRWCNLIASNKVFDNFEAKKIYILSERKKLKWRTRTPEWIIVDQPANKKSNPQLPTVKMDIQEMPITEEPKEVAMKQKGRPNKPPIDYKIFRDMLSSIIEYFEDARPSLGNVALYELVTEKLNRIAGSYWSWRYIQGVHAGTINQPGRKFCQAISALGAALDEVPQVAAYTVQVIVYARPDTIEQGSIILGESRTCKRLGCPVVFVPNVPWRRYCSPECSSQAHRE